MPDRCGNHLRAGDPVLFHSRRQRNEEPVLLNATIIRLVAADQYLIQFEPRGPRQEELSAESLARFNRADSLVAEIDRKFGLDRSDGQNPIQVSGSDLLLRHSLE